MAIEKSLGVTVQRKNLTEQLYEILEDRILKGELLPGTKLSEENVADAFGVSRSPAREAITELERIGLATRLGPRDRTVAKPSREMIAEAFELWWILDSGRTYLASLNATQDDHDRLYQLLDEIDAAKNRNNETKRAALSKEFHELLKRGCENKQIQRTLDDHEKYIRWFKELYYTRVEHSEASRIEHRQIVDHYVQKDLLGLTDVIRKHILRQRDDVLSQFNAAENGEQDTGRKKRAAHG